MNISKFIKKLSMTVAGTAFVAFSGTTVAQAIYITPTSNGEDLVKEILGSGITIVPGSIEYTGAPLASGFFTHGLSSGIGIDKGIILTTGKAQNAQGPNSSDQTTFENVTEEDAKGDEDLKKLIGATTYDATVLEFEFESQGGDVFFNYVFASEEYNQFVNSEFNDVFAFFLNGKNIALIPDTDIPVAINTVNGGSDGNREGDDASYSEFFNNNDLDNAKSLFNIEYNGFTNVFTAQGLNLAPGKHTIKLAIADTSDQMLDSAVFIQAKSFSDVKTPYGETSVQNTEDVPEPSIVIGLLGVGFAGSLLKKKSTKSHN